MTSSRSTRQTLRPLPGRQTGLGGFLVIVIATIGFAILLAAKLSWGVLDAGCPTHSINLVRQLMAGTSPAEFPGVPGVTANYHQGTFWVAARLAETLGLDPLQSLRWTILLAGTAAFTALLLRFQPSTGTWITLLVTLATFFCASLPSTATWPLKSQFIGWYSYISLFEYLVSSSWPLALLVVFVTVLLANGARSPIAFLVRILPGVLILPALNATAFSILWLATGMLVFVEFARLAVRRDRQALGWLLLGLVCGAAYLLPRHYTSAFMVGESYEPVAIAPRYTTYAAKGAILDYLQLQPLLNYLTLVPACLHLRSENRTARLAAVCFLLSFAFPLLIAFTNVEPWDNLHKFVILGAFLTPVLWLTPNNSNSLPVSRPLIVLAMLVALAASIPAQFNHFSSRISYGTPRFAITASPDPELAAFLNQAPPRSIMLWPYGNQEYCGRIGEVLKHSAVYCAGAYSPSFLLAPKLEARVLDERDWFQGDPQPLLARYPELTHYCIFPASESYALETQLRAHGADIEQIGVFGYFSLARFRDRRPAEAK